MMAFMSDTQDNDSSMSEMRDRFEELRDMEMRGELDDQGKVELQELRKRFNQSDL